MSLKKSLYSILILAVILTNLTFADKPIERMLKLVPDHTRVLAATAGADNLAEDFEKTGMGRLWNDPGVKEFYWQIRKAVEPMIEKKFFDPNDALKKDKLLSLGKMLLSRPLVVGALSHKPDKDESWNFFLISHQPEKEQFDKTLTDFLRPFDLNTVDINLPGYEIHKPENASALPACWGYAGEYFFILAGADYSPTVAMKYLRQPRQTPVDLFDDLKQRGEAFSLYVDIAALRQIYNLGIVRNPGSSEAAAIEKIMKMSGADDLQSVTANIDLSDGLMTERMFIRTSGSSGLVRHLRPIDTSTLRLAGANATNVVLANPDIYGIYEDVRQMVAGTSPETDKEFDEKIAEIEEQIGFDLTEGLLKNISGDVVLCNLMPDQSASMVQNALVMFARLEDTSTFEQNMLNLQQYAVEHSDNSIQISSQTVKGYDVHSLFIPATAIMQIIPSWTIAEDYFVFASNTSFVSQAIDRLGQSSVLPDTELAQFAQGLGQKTVYFRYFDARRNLQLMLRQLQQFWPMFCMSLNHQGIKLPFQLPNPEEAINSLEPYYAYTSTEKEGIRFYSRGSGIPNLTATAAAGSAMVAITMPALAKVQEQAKSIKSRSQLRQFGLYCLMYAQENDGQFPPTLKSLIDIGYIECEDLLRSERIPDSVEPHYVYVTGQDTSCAPGNVIAYENPAAELEEYNVLYVDGHVRAVSKQQLIDDLKQTYENLGREMPEFDWAR